MLIVLLPNPSFSGSIFNFTCPSPSYITPLLSNLLESSSHSTPTLPSYGQGCNLWQTTFLWLIFPPLLFLGGWDPVLPVFHQLLKKHWVMALEWTLAFNSSSAIFSIEKHVDWGQRRWWKGKNQNLDWIVFFCQRTLFWAKLGGWEGEEILMWSLTLNRGNAVLGGTWFCQGFVSFPKCHHCPFGTSSELQSFLLHNKLMFLEQKLSENREWQQMGKKSQVSFFSY